VYIKDALGMWFGGRSFPYANYVGLWPVPRCSFDDLNFERSVKGPADTRHPSSTRAYNDPRVKQTPARCIEKRFDPEEQTRRVPAESLQLPCRLHARRLANSSSPFFQNDQEAYRVIGISACEQKSWKLRWDRRAIGEQFLRLSGRVARV